MSIIKWLCRRYMDLFLDRWGGYKDDYIEDYEEEDYYSDDSESLTVGDSYDGD